MAKDKLKGFSARVSECEEKSLKLVQNLSSKPVELTAYRNERNLMFYPICSTSKAKRVKPIEYLSRDKKYFLQVHANHTFGMTKATDLDILRFSLSKAGEIKWQTHIFPKFVEFSAYELLKALKKPVSGRSYEWVKMALQRISTTAYKTNIWRSEETNVFTLADVSFENSTGKLERIRINFNQRLIDSVEINNALLTVDEEIIKETKSQIRKRLLEIVKVAIGTKNKWEIGFHGLKELLAADEMTDKKLKQTLEERIKIPWDMTILKYEKVIFERPNCN